MSFWNDLVQNLVYARDFGLTHVGMATEEKLMELQNGMQAPDFQLSANDGKIYSLQDLRGKKVVLYFYPKDDTPGCTKQACGFRDLQKEFNKLGAVVLGVSRDDLASHDAFKAKYQLNFPLLSDPDAKIHHAYGAWGEKNLYGKISVGPLRTTVVIDEAGKILSWKRNVRAEENPEKTLSLITAS